MTRLHHVNLGVPPDGAEEEATFLVEVLVKIARELDEQVSEMGLGERSRFE